MEKSLRMGLSVVVVLIVGSLLLPAVAAQDPPVEDECLAYAYTKSDKHNFLLGPNSSMFGTTLNIIHNCDQASIYVDGFFLASSKNDFSTMVETGLHNITIEADNQTFNFVNVIFYPDRLEWEYEYELTFEREIVKPSIDLELSNSRTNYAVGIGILMVWVLTTYVYWSLISAYVDRNFIEEVVQ